MVRNNISQSEHDAVVRASSGTYADLERNGCKVAINPDGEKNRWVGSEFNPRYPDVVVWKPDYPGAGSGKAVIIEEVETGDSVTADEAEQWKDYSSLKIKFVLTVPKEYVSMATEIVNSKKIAVAEIWYYYTENGSIKFDKYR